MPGFEHKAFTQSKVEIHEPELAAMVMRGDYLGRRARLLRRWRWALAAALLLLLAVAALLLLVGPGQRAAAQDLPLRLHIIANSDNAADQALKLQVRDAVVEYLTPLLAQVQTREEAEQLLAEQLPQLEALAAGMTADFGYGAQAEMGRFVTVSCNFRQGNIRLCVWFWARARGITGGACCFRRFVLWTRRGSLT